ncbi:MAG: hypothetical protein E3K32_11070 [wastewater metagenome]|nr:hypothetical protein [Candidatus Loosdrechtia aerotolerans]
MKIPLKRCTFLLLLVCGVLFSFTLSAESKSHEVVDKGRSESLDETRRMQITEDYGRLPLCFIQNDGQMDERVRFYERGNGHAMFFTKRGVCLSLHQPSPAGEKDIKVRGQETHDQQQASQINNPYPETIRLIPLGANKDPEIVADGLQEGRVNYFVGDDPEKWKTNIPTYSSVMYKEIYQGIDMKFYGNNRQMEYDVIVKPGAHPSRVQFSYEGIEDLRITEEGELEIGLKEGKLIQKKPYIYQEIEGKRVRVEGSFKVLGSDAGTQDRKSFLYGFQVTSYDKKYPLIIDPVLTYSTYLGGSRGDFGNGIAVDSSGNAYVTGRTNSAYFPMANALYGSYNGGSDDVFVTKIDATGSSLQYSTYLGGGESDYGNEIAVDSLGNAYVTGRTNSTDFPMMNAFIDSHGGDYDAFVTKIDATGSRLQYSTYLGGSRDDWGYGIAVDSLGNAYVTGRTNSTNFPTANALYGINSGNWDAFITKLDATGSSLQYSTYLGGGKSDYGNGIAVDSSGNAYVAGETYSTDFPTANALYGSHNGYYDVFVAKLDATGSSLLYSTYLGGSDYDHGQGIAVDSLGNAYVTGRTESTDFPMMNAFIDSHGGGYHYYFDAFVTKIDATGSSLQYSTYLGGSGDDMCYAIAADSSGNAYVTGTTNSTDFPMSNALYESKIGSYYYFDAFVTKIDATGSSLQYSTYLGGDEDDNGYGIAVDSSGNTYVTGYTKSTDFPMSNALYGINSGYSDAFIAKITPDDQFVCEADSITTFPDRLIIGKGKKRLIKVTVMGAGGCPVEGATVVAHTRKKGREYISVSPRFQTTDANGQAVFVVKANETGKTFVLFKIKGLKSFAVVRVGVKQ